MRAGAIILAAAGLEGKTAVSDETAVRSDDSRIDGSGPTGFGGAKKRSS